MNSTPIFAPNNICPLCSQANECQAASLAAGQSCWCVALTFDEQVLNSLQGEKQSCLCQACAQSKALK